MQEYKMLIMFDTKANSNKFYEMRLDASGTTHIKFGRVGAGSQSTSYSGGLAKFNSLLKSKLKKGYVESEVEHVAEGQVVVKNNVMDIALKQIIYLDEVSKQLIERIAKENIHNITSNTNIKFDVEDGLFKTPLGIVKKTGVEKAMEILTQIDTLLLTYHQGIGTQYEDELYKLNENYFVLIPSKVKYANDKDYLLFSSKNVEAQRNICNALLDTLELIEELKEKAEKSTGEVEVEEDKVFDVQIGLVEDATTLNAINKYYNDSKHTMHGNRIMGSKINKVYKIRLGNQQEGFDAKEKEIGNVHQFWHGTRLANILSIFSRGLMMPKDSPGQQAGAMYGAGVYFANRSSKSIQYTDGGRYSGGGSSGKVYMFLANVAVGEYYVPRSSTGSSGRPPKGYDSFWAKAGESGVVNDEIIVFNLDQIRLDYLVEIDY